MLGGSAASVAIFRNLVNSAGVAAYASNVDSKVALTAGGGAATGDGGRRCDGGTGAGAGFAARTGFGVTMGVRSSLASGGAGVSGAVSRSSVASCSRVSRGRTPEEHGYRPHAFSTAGKVCFLSIVMLLTPKFASGTKMDSSSRSSSCFRKVSERIGAPPSGAGCASRATRAATMPRAMVAIASVLFFADAAAASICRSF